MASGISEESRGPQGRYAHRPLAWGRNGMVGAGTQLTANAGVQALWQGGNAMDAAATTVLAGSVIEATAYHTLGGEIAMLYYDASERRVHSIIGQGWAPAKATIDYYMQTWGEIPPGIPSTTVPGIVSALLAMLERHGTWSFARTAESAINYAANGFPAYQLFCRMLASPRRRDHMFRHPESAAIFYPDGKLPIPGSLVKQTQLAATLRAMASAEARALETGGSRADGIQAARDEFYKGRTGRAMVEALQRLGGLYDYQDFAEYTSPFEEPLHVDYRGYTVYTNGVWTQGIVTLQALQILNGFDLRTLGHNSAESIHLQAEALKLAFADRERYVGDPAFVDVPAAQMISERYARLRGSLISPHKAVDNYPPGDPMRGEAVLSGHAPGFARIAAPAASPEGTTHVAIADDRGNFASATPSSFSALSRGMALGDTGVFINCRGCYFWLDPNNPNALAPRKRPRTTPCAFIITKDGLPFLTLGTPGADNQTQSILQVICNIIDYDLNLQEAVEAPRFATYSLPSSPWPHAAAPNNLDLEGRVGAAVMDALRDCGHEVRDVGPWGVVNGFTPILRDPTTGTYQGGADPRRESAILGL